MMAIPQSTNKITHPLWVKLTHWIGTISFLFLVFTGIEILMVHPRLYWGNVGNDLVPALFELPISRNFHHGGWTSSQPFFTTANSPVSASRTYDIFNQNGWGRSLHFLSAWILVITGLIYLMASVFSKHLYRNLWPKEFSWRLFFSDISNHIRMKSPITGSGYGLLQKFTYSVVLFFLVPVIVLTGLTMSPAVTAGYPLLLKIFFGAQSARTIHFFAAVLLILFLVVHIVMIVRTGFKRQMRAMTFDKTNKV